MNYTAKTVSSCTAVTHPEAVNGIISMFDIRFETRIENNELKIWGDDTFDVFNTQSHTEQTEAFLAALSFFLTDTLTITSIGYTGNRHEPTAFKWKVTPDLIKYTQLDGVEEQIQIDSVVSDIPEHIKTTFLTPYIR